MVCSVIALVVLVGLSVWSYAMLGWNLEIGLCGSCIPRNKQIPHSQGKKRCIARSSEMKDA